MQSLASTSTRRAGRRVRMLAIAQIAFLLVYLFVPASTIFAAGSADTSAQDTVTTSTSSSSPTPTDSPTPAPTPSPSPSPTDSPTPSPTDSPTPAPTDSPAPSPTPTATPAPSYVPTGLEALTTTGAIYWSTQTVAVSGTGFQPDATVILAMVEPAGSLGQQWSVTTASDGTFSTGALLLGGAGQYTVRAYGPDWAGDLAQAPLASTSFAAQLPFTEGLIVTFVAGTSSADQDAAIARDGGTQTMAIPVLNMRSVDTTSDVATTVFDAYASDSVVAHVEYDQSRSAEATPNDTSYPFQWSLPKIGWDQAYGSIAPTGSSTVAILDTGIDASHPDLAGSVVAGTSVLDGSNGETDPNGHGTWMAGIVAAATNNGLGVAGVGYAGVRVMPVTVLRPDGTGQDSDIISGVVWATQHGANVILMAFSNPGYSPALQAAIDYAWSHGVVLVAATGNDSSTLPSYPAGDREVVGVSATDSSDALATFSNSGADTFLAAPGVAISTTDLGGGYTSIDGTSASAAEVAAAAALAQAVDPSVSNGVIVGRLAESADPAGTSDQTGNGRLNLDRALLDTGTNFVTPAGAPGGGPLVGPYVAAAASITSISVGAQSGTLTYGTSASATFAVTVTGSGTGFITIGVTGLPTGASFSPTRVPATGTQNCSSNGCNFSLTITTTGSGVSRTPAGSSTFTVSVTGDQHGQGANTANGTLTVGKRALTVSATGVNKVYDGTAAATVTLSDNRVAGDVFTDTYTTAVFADKNVGTGKTVSVSGVSISGTDAANYTLSSTTTSTMANITARPITVTAATDSKVYDGTASSVGVPTITSGSLAPGDSATWTQTFDTKNVGTGKTLTPSGSVSDGNGGANYSITFAPVTTGTITARPLTVDFTAANKTYDGTAAATITGCSLAGVLGGDTVACDYGGATASFADANVGTAKTVTGSGFALTGAQAGNYAITTTHTTTADITALGLTVDFTAANKTYDGTAAATITGCSLAGVLGGDTVACDYGGATASFADANVGTAKTVTGSGFALTGAQAGNYAITTTHTTTADITARPVAVTADPKTKVYGAPDPALTYEVTSGSVVFGDNFSGALTRVAGENVGTYAITQGTLTLGSNYYLTYVGANLTITQASTSTGLTSSLNPSILGQSVTFTATVSVVSPGAGTPTGTVTFMDSSTTLGTGTLNGSGVATYTTSVLAVGSHSITAVYGGDSNFIASTSPALTQKVTYASSGTCYGAPGHAILQPINSDGSSVFKQGSTVPAKFRVCDANGVSIGTPGVVSSFVLYKTSTAGTLTVDEAVDSTTPDTAFRWDSTSQQWIFNMSSKSLKSGTIYYYKITLNDGSTILFNFALK